MPSRLLFERATGFAAACTLTMMVPAVALSSELEVDPQTVEKAPAAVKPATARVEKGPFKIEVVLSGIFEARRMNELAIRPRAWAPPLVVDRAVELGTPVNKGDILVEFDREKIDKAIQDAELENTLAELALKQAEEEVPFLEKSLPVDLAAALRARTHADEDLKRFLETERAQSERNAQFMVKRAVEYLEYSREELRQLEKMYRSKDLTEETEEIILRRQRFDVEVGEFFKKEAELQRHQTLNVELPRQEQRVRENAVKLAIELEKARSLLPLTLTQKRLAMAKLKHDHAKAVEKLADLRQDRESLTVHAPADGLVYYGRCERGHWSAAAIAPKLHKGGAIAADEVFITVVAPNPLDVRAIVEEKDLYALTQSKEPKTWVTPTFDPEQRLPARVSGVMPVPREAGKFEAVIAVEIAKQNVAIRPGMACSVQVVSYRQENALTVPSTTVFEDDSTDAITRYVYLAKPDKDGKFPRRQVKTGKTANGKTEILEGLVAGDEVLASKP